MTEWKEYKLGDLIKVKHGFAFKGDYIVPDETDKILAYVSKRDLKLL